MKKLILLAVLFGGYYLHGRTSFSEAHVMNWLGKHEASAMSGDPAACNDFTDDLQVSLTAEGARGRWEVEGGKNEMCGYLRQSAAVFTVLQASTNADFSDVKIVREGFPWTRARVSYRQRTAIRAERVPEATVNSEDELVLVRTPSGLRIKSVNSSSSGGL
jgi:hypothetical protein